MQSEGHTYVNPNSFEFGVDPSLDPELALALRISMEEEQARMGGNVTETVDTPMAQPSEEDDMLAQALALSMGDRPVFFN